VATVIVQRDDLVVALNPLEKLAALRGDVRVPLSAVRAVLVEPYPWLAMRGIGAPGTGLPGVIAYGVRRMTRDRNDFAALIAGRSAIRVELDAPASFARLLVSVDDAASVAASIRAAAAAAGVRRPSGLAVPE
jgi:hypothetical protein